MANASPSPATRGRARGGSLRGTAAREQWLQGNGCDTVYEARDAIDPENDDELYAI